MKKTKQKRTSVSAPFAQVEQYNASIKIFGKFYTATGSTAKEAIANLKPEGVSKGMSVLTISKGDVKKERILNTMQTYRLFSVNPLMKELAIKNVALFFENI